MSDSRLVVVVELHIPGNALTHIWSGGYPLCGVDYVILVSHDIVIVDRFLKWTLTYYGIVVAAVAPPQQQLWLFYEALLFCYI
jgi:hypothetical protein